MAMRPTAAHREGGKFGNMASSRGGKFANMMASQQAKTAAETAGSGSESSAVKKKTRPPRVERQKQIFADLDEAEKLVLGMMQIASSTASALSDLTEVGGGGNEGAAAEEMLAKLAKSNGEEYLAKVKRIHSLLSPHAKLVVAYRNHQVDIADDGGGSSGGGSISSGGAAGATAIATNKVDDGKTAKSHNMYASRVEMRLAMERRDVLREFLRLEKKEINEGGAKNESISADDSVDTSAKRKREDEC
uniref:Uncharacterized protein n=1 Tax=Ditylum brightwellii TaxID=49249 RepID=A0A7S4RVD7_9STRA|mmetsp:Transcript_16519/g.23397  ORF Transcript_16519/g.23397 Transcript_16519/m.23397 type:complete len:247 (-) Transcript_16519:365-1105(-)